MNPRLIKVPFNVETARKITEGKIKGRIIDVVFNCPARILDFNFNSCVGELNIVVSERERGEVFCACNDEGCMFLGKDDKFDERPLFMLEIPKSEEKFGNTLNPFDKVLVRDNNMDEWKADFFSNYKEDVFRYGCVSGSYIKCIPYNEQTKHLLGTKNDI